LINRIKPGLQFGPRIEYLNNRPWDHEDRKLNIKCVKKIVAISIGVHPKYTSKQRFQKRHFTTISQKQ